MHKTVLFYTVNKINYKSVKTLAVECQDIVADSPPIYAANAMQSKKIISRPEREKLCQKQVTLTGNFWPAISVGEFCRGGGCRSPWETRYCSRLTSVAQESAQVWRWTTLLEQRSSKRG